jgi:F0F1-type ATP synthase delta subunit
MPFSIKSAQALSNNQLDSVKKYLATKTGRSIIATTAVDKELIAGIRAQSSTFLLEYSLAQQLRALKNNEV